MYLHLGNGVVIKSDTIVGFFDIDKVTVKTGAKTFLKEMQKKDKIVNVGKELPKTFIVSVLKGETRVFLSPLLSRTLLKRNEKESL